MGHKRTIRPNAKRLSALFMAKNQMDWDTFARKVKSCQRGFMGEPEEMKPGRGEFHEFPYSCICEKPVTDEEHKDRDHHLDKASAHLIAKLQSKDTEKKGEKKFKKKGLVEEQITSVHIEGEELFPD